MVYFTPGQEQKKDDEHMKVLVVFGTRPEAIKMCPVIMELKKRDGVECRVCLTGQHREMLEQVMQAFHITADYNLNIMQENQNLSMIAVNIIRGLDEILEKECPDYILVHGDTSSSFAAALSAFYHHIPIGHVEAGLRTYDMQEPYPEEFNRQCVDLIADIYFAPTELAKKQLLQEGKSEERIFVTGNTVIDALKTTVNEDYNHEILKWSEDSRLIMVTAHRRENIGEPMENMFRAINRITKDVSDVKVVYPIHKNPKVRQIAESIFKDNKKIRLIEPLDVFDFHNFMNKSFFVMTDSGGIQEEAPSLGKPVLVMRNTTERPEGVEAGTLKLVGTDEEYVYQSAIELLSDPEKYEAMSKASNPYGDGYASRRIADILTSMRGEKKDA